MTSHRRNWLWLFATLAVCVAVGGAIAATRGRPSERAPAARIPEQGAYRYRYSLTIADESADHGSTIAALEARLRDSPSSPIDAAELADTYFRRGQLTGDRADLVAAEKYAQQSLAILRKPNGALLTLAKLKNARHEFREAIELANEHLANKPGASSHLVIATARLALGELEAATASTDKAIAMRPDTHGYTTRALVMQARGRDVEAGAAFAHAVKLEQPGDKHGAARLRALWARFLIRRGEYAAAKVVVDEALRIVPELPLAIAQRGELALRTGKASEAAKHFERAFELSHQVRYLMDEARARELAGNRDVTATLRVQIESIVRRELEDDAGHRMDLVEVLTDRGTPEALAEAATLGREELLRRGSLEVRFQLARALYRSGQVASLGSAETRSDAEAVRSYYDAAMAQVEVALANGTREAQLFELAARIETARGNRQNAATYTASADELDPMRSGWRALGLGSAK